MSTLNRVAKVVGKVRHIQEESKTKGNSSSKYITDRCNTIARHEHEILNVIVDKKSGELLSEPVCSHRYYSQLMENYRNGVKALGFKHHNIERNINSFLRKYSGALDGIDELINPDLSIQQLRDNLIILRAKSVTGSELRRDLLSLKIEHHAYYMFEPKGAVKDWIRDDDKSKLTKKLHNQILVNPAWIKQITSDLLSKSSPSVSDLCIGLALATGRRLTEVLKTAQLTKVADNKLLFTGQLKTKNRHLFEEVKPYEIPCMVKAETVIKALKLLRKKTEGEKIKYPNVLGEIIENTVGNGDTKDYDHNKAVHKRYESTINRDIRFLLKNGHFSLKDCRAIYTEITYDEHSNAGEARSAYRHRVLGHSIIETQLHYEAFKIDESITTIKLLNDDKADESTADTQSALVDYLTKADSDVIAYARAPKIAIMHEWLKSEISNGLKIEVITPSYIRRHCLFDGKQLNLNTIKKYVNEFIKLDQYKPPKPKPKNDNERKIEELESKIEELENDSQVIENQKDDLDQERDEIIQRLEDIKHEDEQLTEELEDVTEQLEEAQFELEHLQLELDEENDDDITDEKTEWPSPDEIKITAKKDGKMWHVLSAVNGKTFEQWTSGTKTAAIKEFKDYYQESIKTN